MNRRPVHALAAALCAGALLAAGCGSSSKSSSSGSSSGSAPAASGSTVAVKMSQIMFAPKSISAKVGQTVTWTNEDSTAHNVTAQQGESFKSSDFNKGQTYSYKVDKPGTIKYVCTIHPGMEGTVTVTK